MFTSRLRVTGRARHQPGPVRFSIQTLPPPGRRRRVPAEPPIRSRRRIDEQPTKQAHAAVSAEVCAAPTATALHR